MGESTGSVRQSPPPAAGSSAARVWAALDAKSPYIVDAMVAVLTLTVTLTMLVATAPAAAPVQPWWSFALACGTAVPLAWRRRAPLAVTAMVAVSSAVFASVPLVPPPPTPIGLLVAAYTIGDRGRLWQRRVAVGVGVPTILLLFRGPLEGVAQPLIMVLGSYALGTVVRSRRGYAAALEVRARDLERERDIEAERATMAERARIAREMHDILGHAVSIMVVQAEAGPVVVRTDPDRAIAVFDVVAAAGREALHQIQRLLGLLAGDDAEQLAPQPRLADLGRLLAGVRVSGLVVTMTTGGTPRGVPPDLEAAVFRMIQEALTNTVKHADATACAVRIDWAEQELLVEVSDDGRGAAAHQSAGGRGLVGIRERAAAFGGSMAAGTNAAGSGFTVAVRIPVPQLSSSPYEVE